MGLVVSRAERRLVSNLSTGSQFLGRESNSHYHLHMKCLSTVCPAFNGRLLEIPHNVKANLSLMHAENVLKLLLWYSSLIKVMDNLYSTFHHLFIIIICIIFEGVR